MGDAQPTDLEAQHMLVPAELRDELWSLFINAKISGYEAFKRAMVTIMAATLSGRITPEQAKACAPFAELLFTAEAADQIRQDAAEAQRIRNEADPTKALILEAQRRAASIRPQYEITDNGGSVSLQQAGVPVGQPSRRVVDVTPGRGPLDRG